MKVDVSCDNVKCPNYGRVINTITFPWKEEDSFFESFGHGGEDPQDFCKVCGKLGVLQDPGLTEEEKTKVREFVKEKMETDELEFDDDAEVHLDDEHKGTWIKAWVWLDLEDVLPSEEGT